MTLKTLYVGEVMLKTFYVKEVDCVVEIVIGNTVHVIPSSVDDVLEKTKRAIMNVLSDGTSNDRLNSSPSSEVERPHVCPRCGGHAYVGFTTLDCERGCK